jgi:exo-poly-alpha-galacturonosidase
MFSFFLGAAAAFTLAALVTAAAQPAPRRYVVAISNTRAIQNLIDRAAREGGGTLVVPAGTFVTGALFFKQGVNLSIEKGGVLKGSINPEDYPQVQTRWEGTEREWTSALLNFTGMTDVELSGEGTVDGSGDEWLARGGFGRGQQPRAPQEGAAPPRPRAGRPRMICFQNCKRVRIANLKLRQQAVWCLHILYSEDVTVDGVSIMADHNIPSSDGIDIDSSRRVRVNNVDIDVNDDCITIKSGKDADGLRVNRPAEDIVIENSRFHYGHGGVAMGSETSGGIRNVEVRNCVSDAGNWAPIRFKTQPSRGGVVENITYRDMQLKDTKQAFEFNMEWRMVPPIAPPAKVLPVVRNVTIRNITGNVNSVGIMHGLVDSPIENVKFENCKITAQKGFVIENARKVDLSGLTVDVTEGAPITRRNVQ